MFFFWVDRYVGKLHKLYIRNCRGKN